MNTKLKHHTINLKFKDKTKGISVVINADTNTSELLDIIAGELACGIGVIELSSTNCSDKLTLEFSKKLKQLAEIYEAILIIKNRTDIAYLASADSLLLDAEGIDTNCAKELIGNDILLGFELTPDSINKNTNQKIKNGVDYIVITDTQPTPIESSLFTGLEYAKWVSENSFIPVLIRENTVPKKYFNVIHFKLIMPLVDSTSSPYQ